MTVSTSTNSIVYRGNGATTAFAVPFKVLDEDHLVVTSRDYTTGELVDTYVGTDYTYSGVGDDAGTLTLDGAALDDDYELIIQRIVPYTQDLDIVNAGGFYPETVEEQLDLIVMAVQQIAELSARAITVPVGETPTELSNAAERAGLFLAFDAEGDPTLTEGTGSDGALRADLASVTGPTLVKWFRSGATAIDLSLASYFALQPFNPYEYGAEGDGVTDDTDALNDCAADAASAGGVMVIPLGTFAITDWMDITNGVRAAVGLGGTIKIKSTAAAMCGLRLKGKESGAAANVQNCDLLHLRIDCNDKLATGILLENAEGCLVQSNKILNCSVNPSIGIHDASYNGAGQSSSNANKIFDNDLDCMPTVTLGSNYATNTGAAIGIAVEAETSSVGGANAFWLTNKTGVVIPYPATNGQVSRNRVYGGYYGLSFSGANDYAVNDNHTTNNVRGYSVQNTCARVVIDGGRINQHYSSAVHLAYGSTFCVAKNLDIMTARSGGGNVLNAYLGCEDGGFINNTIVIVAPGVTQFQIYIGPHCSRFQVQGNKLNGHASKAYICVESAWKTTTSHAYSFAIGLTPTGDYNLAANAGMSGVVIGENTVNGSVQRPAVLLIGMSDGGGTYTLAGTVIAGNKMIGTFGADFTDHLRIYEETSGAVTTVSMPANAWHPSATTAAHFTLPRGRAHFSLREGNGPLDDNGTAITFTATDTTPSVGVGKYFQGGNGAGANITMFDDGTDGQEIIYRGDANSVLKHDGTKIKLRGAVDVTPTADQIVTFRRAGGIWMETARNF